MYRYSIQEKLRELIRSRTGYDLRDVRDRGTLEPFLVRRVRALGLSQLEDYLELLSCEETSGQEFTRLIAVITNPHTYFFRDEAQFAAARRLAQKNPPRTVWSAGCSTGEEPYTLAMLLTNLGLSPRIWATDINQEVLALAHAGIFSPWSVRRCPERFRQRYLVRVNDGSYRVSNQIRQMVSFCQHNLVEEVYPPPDGEGTKWDWIFCRNVLLYFNRDTIGHVLKSFASVLDDDGWLFLSTAEHVHGIEPSLQVVTIKNSFAYCLKNEPTVTLGTESPRELISSIPSSPPSLRHRDDSIIFPLVEVREESQEVDLYARAITMADRGELDQARELLHRYLKKYPDDGKAWTTQGNFCLRLHDFDNALSAYERSRKQDPLLPEVHYFQGVVYRKVGDFPRAIHAFRQALFLDPQFWNASFMLGGLYGRTGNQAARRRNFSRTLELLNRGVGTPLFISHVNGMDDALLEPNETRRICRRYLMPLINPSV